MDYFDGFADFTPLVLPLEPEWPTLWKLVERLKELNYNEKRASEALGVRYLAGRNTVMDPYHLKICRSKMASSPAAILTAFFLMQEWTIAVCWSICWAKALSN